MMDAYEKEKTILLTTFLTGTPNGPVKIEKPGWTGEVFASDRFRLDDFDGEEAIDRPGTYILLGGVQENKKKRIYIGCASSMRAHTC